MEIGKIPPQAVELEEAVLGALLIESKTLDEVNAILKPESFYKETHQKIYRAILNLKDQSKAIDILTVANELRSAGLLDEVGGAYYLASLTSKIGSAVHVDFHAKVIAEKYIRREIIRLSSELVNTMFDEHSELISEINTFDNQLKETLSFTKSDEKHIMLAVNEMAEYSIKLNENLIPKGIPTGYTYFDDFSGGIQRGDLMIIAGETSSGKTTLALNILRNTSIHGTRSAIYSYEMTSFQIAARMVAHDQKISSKDIIRGMIPSNSIKLITSRVTRLVNSQTYIVKPSGTGFAKLVQDISRMVKLYGLDLIVIDYLQLISNSKKGLSTADMIAEMSNRLKSLAVELNVAIILLSQLARDKHQPRPTLSRLKGSGDIENAADIVLFTYLPYKYGKNFEEVNGESKEVGKNAIFIVDKGRNIGTTQFVVEFKEEIPAFFNYFEQVDWNPKDFTEPVHSNPFD